MAANDTHSWIMRWWQRSREGLQDLADDMAEAGFNRDHIVQLIAVEVEDAIPAVRAGLDALINPKFPGGEEASDAAIALLLERLQRRIVEASQSTSGRKARRASQTIHRVRALARASVVAPTPRPRPVVIDARTDAPSRPSLASPPSSSELIPMPEGEG